MSCVQCKKAIIQIETKVTCNACKVVCIHQACIKIEPKVGRPAKWVCPTCKSDPSYQSGGSGASDDEDKMNNKTMMSMLVNIQSRMKKLDRLDAIERDTKQIPELKSEVAIMSQKYDQLLDKLNKQDELIKSLKQDVKELKGRVQMKDSEVGELTIRVQELEQQQLAMGVTVHGLPVKAGEKEDTLELVKRISEGIGAPLQESSIDDCYRVYANPNNSRLLGQPPVLVVKFKTTDARRVWLDKKATRNLTVGQVYNTQNTDKIRVFEQLTPDMKRLLYKTRVAAKEKDYQFTWVKNGKIFVRHSENQGVVRIRSEKDINSRIKLIRDQVD